jgi:polyhydroxyalkanoate synthesis repressor PhaR
MATEDTMIRLIKRYGGGSRKLYDTEESRYVALDEIAAWVRQGQQLKVVDSASDEDVTAQTLAQVIYETHKSGTTMLSSDFLHDAIRRGGQAISQKVEQLQVGVDRLVRRSVEKLPGAHAARTELETLRQSLRALEASIGDLEQAAVAKPRRAGGRNGNGKAKGAKRHSRRGTA